jgi:hypothetical protein
VPNKLDNIKLLEVSLVKTPANPHARAALILKHQPESDDMNALQSAIDAAVNNAIAKALDASAPLIARVQASQAAAAAAISVTKSEPIEKHIDLLKSAAAPFVDDERAKLIAKGNIDPSIVDETAQAIAEARIFKSNRQLQRLYRHERRAAGH